MIHLSAIIKSRNRSFRKVKKCFLEEIIKNLKYSAKKVGCHDYKNTEGNNIHLDATYEFVLKRVQVGDNVDDVIKKVEKIDKRSNKKEVEFKVIQIFDYLNESLSQACVTIYK